MLNSPSKKFWKSKTVLITGGAGFIGSHIAEQLVELGSEVTILDRVRKGKEKNIQRIKSKIRIIKGDCTNSNDAEKACKGQKIILNLAAKVGGIEYNRIHQGTMLKENLMIGTTILEAARKAKIERFLVVSSACVYPRGSIIPTPETEGFKDEPEPTNSGYGWGKRMAELLGKYYAQEFKMQIGIVRPYNCYGPRDNFDPAVSHVIPGLIKRVLDGENPVVVWGSGKQTRAFLYVDDLARGIIMAAEKYPQPDPINLGTDEEVSIKELIEMIIRLTGVTAKIKFDKTKPDGSLRRNSNNKKAKDKIGFKSAVTLEEGLKKTIEWYKSNYNYM